ncbi:hypothetical protein EW026_g2057 [Hermanssonia centrifuga]|uniref:Uncharacterized protein n=1 Tax=Hermanssonia centrifuga TaxID=98765 RepID=A0A4S4KQG0_9APHY|nr:hypothetical protein EW026_g2057 [Hermanssonia centrifuga]
MVFVLAYNLETSLHMVGVSPSKLSSSYLSKVGLINKDPGYERDGRRPQAWRDELENIIAGDWLWEEGEIAGVERGQIGVALSSGSGSKTVYNVGKAKSASRSAARESLGVGVTNGTTAQEQLEHWGDSIPESKAIAHVAGYTILENVFILNGTGFLVTDSASSLPPLGSMASSAVNSILVPRGQDWRVLNRVTAQDILGTFGGRIRGTTWLTTEPADSQDPYTVFSLHRLHSYLASPHSHAKVSPSGLHILSPDSANVGLGGSQSVTPPLRMWLPRVPTLSSPSLPPIGKDEKAHPPLREKSYTGSHPSLYKAMFPTVGILYAEDWKDYADMQIPFLLERVLLVDRGAAERGRSEWGEKWSDSSEYDSSNDELRKRQAVEDGLPVWAAPFVAFDVSSGWFEPVRSALRSYLRLPAESTQKKRKPELTYVSMAGEPQGSGPRIRDEDHPELLKGLHALKAEGILGEVHVVRGNGTRDVWEDRMTAISTSNIMLGAFGGNLADSVFMTPPSKTEAPQPDSAPVLMEFFPSGTFLRDQEYAVRSVGLRYTAWWGERCVFSLYASAWKVSYMYNRRKFKGISLPQVMGPRSGQNLYVGIDVPAVLEEIRAEAKRLSS